MHRITADKTTDRNIVWENNKINQIVLRCYAVKNPKCTPACVRVLGRQFALEWFIELMERFGLQIFPDNSLSCLAETGC